MNFYFFIVITKIITTLCFKCYCANDESVSEIQSFVGILG
ncbi:hypothetical protein HMPREF1572_01142 [Gardnerella vaginalis JCP7275]|nr:hypothetical protein HMPREF1572_01142 [Gardnerella vaginalis JCP7275]